MQSKYFLSLIIIIGLGYKLQAHDSASWQINASIGMYEAFSVGIQYLYKPNLGISFGLGSQFGLVKNQKYWSVSLSHDWIFREKGNSLTSWSLSKKFILWKLSDSWYNWTVLSMEPALCKRWKLDSKSAFQIDVGPVFMVVLGFKRKTFSEVGWPRYFNINASVKYQYAL